MPDQPEKPSLALDFACNAAGLLAMGIGVVHSLLGNNIPSALAAGIGVAYFAPKVISPLSIWVENEAAAVNPDKTNSRDKMALTKLVVLGGLGGLGWGIMNMSYFSGNIMGMACGGAVVGVSCGMYYDRKASQSQSPHP